MTTAVESDRLERIEGKLSDITRELDALAATRIALDELLEQVGTAREFVADMVPLTPEAMHNTTERLAELDRRGYLGFAREGLGVVDRVVTSYDEDDVRALADNVVLILDTIKEMTQPEVLGMLSRTIHSIDGEDDSTPSLLHIARQLREPEVKRGLNRLMSLLRSMGQTTETKEKP